MKLQAKSLISTLLLMLLMAFSVDALATNDGNNGNGRGNGWGNGWGNSWGNSHDWDHEDDHHDWDDDSDDDWNDDWNGSWKKDWDNWGKWSWGHSHGSKVFICHRTSSSRNPYVLIQVSTSAKSAHYGHGDPVEFSDRGNGKCAPSSSTPDPTANLSLAADEIFVGATTTATWTSTNATSCKLNNTTVAVSGSAPVGPYTSTGTKTITLTCTGAGGSDTDTEELKVKSAPLPPKPTVNLSLAADEIAIGATTTATWTSTNATECKIGSTVVALNGSAPVGPYSSSGYKTITVTCTGAGGSDSDSEKVKVESAPKPNVSLSLADYVYVGETTDATWTSTNATECKIGSTVVALNGSAPVGPYSSTGNQTITIKCTGPGGSDSDSETIRVKTPPPPPPVVTVTLEPSQIVIGAQTVLAWTSTGATSCKLYGTGSLYGYNWSIHISTNGDFTKGPFNHTGQATYTIKCDGPGGTTSQSVTLTVIDAVPAPTVTLSLAASSIDVNTTTTATWTSTNTTSCTLSNGATSSPAQVGPYATPGNVTLTVTCTGPGGTVSASETLTVNALPAPTVTLSLAASEILVNATTTATWTSTNTTSCTLSNGATSSPAQVGPYADAGNVTLTVNCTGPGGSVSASQTLVVKHPAPTVTLTLAASEILVNATTTATWTSTNTTSCTLSNGATSSPAQVGPYANAGNVTLTVNCTGPGGSVSASQTLAVVHPAPTVTLTLAASEILVNATTTATWTSTNATSCTLSNGATASPAQVGPYANPGNVTLTVDCTGPGGTVSASQTLNVKQLPPTVTLSLAASEIDVGETTTATWSSTNATSCDMGNGATSGSANVGPYSTGGARTITVTCTGPGGTGSASQQLTVDAGPPPAPTVSLSLAALQINIGETTTATWTSTNATSCTLGDGSPAGSAQVGPYAEAGIKTVSITCTGASGAVATASQTVLVVGLPPATTPVCVISNMGAGAAITWIVDYNAANGQFSGAILPSTGWLIEGTITPAAGIYLTGSTVSAQASTNGVPGETVVSRSGAFGSVSGTTLIGFYQVTVTAPGAPSVNTSMTFRSFCPEILLPR